LVIGFLPFDVCGCVRRWEGAGIILLPGKPASLTTSGRFNYSTNGANKKTPADSHSTTLSVLFSTWLKLINRFCNKSFCHVDATFFLSPEPSPTKFLHVAWQIEQGNNLHEFPLFFRKWINFFFSPWENLRL
jgi:hypothetical protein